jgi:hypothetical protein
MARINIDGVIEAVRYTPGGAISVVRTYQRHGVVWSDHIILDRAQLVELLEKGKRFVIGTRKDYLGGVFETGLAVRWINQHVVTEGKSAQRDLLAGVLLF